MIIYLDTLNGGKIAEILPGSEMISTPVEMLDIMTTEMKH